MKPFCFFSFHFFVVKSVESQKGMDNETEQQSGEETDLWQKLKDFAGYLFLLLYVIDGCESP